ncbi:MAG: glutamate formimidoyltransferase [Bacteroidales bacterium]
MSKQVIECVPNFSTSDDLIIQEIKECIIDIDGVFLCNIDKGISANRTVFTFVGEPESVIKAAFAAIKKASERIDMNTHTGSHPRIGATDVCPIIPIKNITKSQANDYALQLASKVGNELSIPVYLYEYSSTNFQRSKLYQIREGEYEKFAAKMKQPQWKPDFGPHSFNSKTGATVIGVRDLLIAFNINLHTKKVEIARTIAGRIREKNKKEGLAGIQAIGWYIKDFDVVQVSCNITDYTQTGLAKLFEKVSDLAIEYNTYTTGSELIGLVPYRALENMYDYVVSHNLYAHAHNPIQTAIEYLGLNTVKPFYPETHIIEYILDKYNL